MPGAGADDGPALQVFIFFDHFEIVDLRGLEIDRQDTRDVLKALSEFFRCEGDVDTGSERKFVNDRDENLCWEVGEWRLAFRFFPRSVRTKRTTSKMSSGWREEAVRKFDHCSLCGACYASGLLFVSRLLSRCQRASYHGENLLDRVAGLNVMIIVSERTTDIRKQS